MFHAKPFVVMRCACNSQGRLLSIAPSQKKIEEGQRERKKEKKKEEKKGTSHPRPPQQLRADEAQKENNKKNHPSSPTK